MDHRRNGAASYPRASHGSRRPDEVRPRGARIPVPGCETWAFALRADARGLARRDACLANHHLGGEAVPRLDVRLPADTTRRRHPIQHLDLSAARGDAGKAAARSRPSAASDLTTVGSCGAGRPATGRSRHCTAHRRAATTRLLVLQLPHLVLPAPPRRGHPAAARAPTAKMLTDGAGRVDPPTPACLRERKHVVHQCT